MIIGRASVLVVENSRSSLSRVLKEALVRHEVEVAADGIDAIYRIDCRIDGRGRPHDVIFCDLACDDFPGSELWAFLALGRRLAAERVVFVASGPLQSRAWSFLDGVANSYVDLSTDAEALDAFLRRRASRG